MRGPWPKRYGYHLSIIYLCFSAHIIILRSIISTAIRHTGLRLSSSKTIGGMLFADDFVGISDSKESLQKLIDVVYR